MWLDKAAHAGFTALAVLTRRPMTRERLMRYPVAQGGQLNDLFAAVAPQGLDGLILSVLITARAGDRGRAQV